MHESEITMISQTNFSIVGSLVSKSLTQSSLCAFVVWVSVSMHVQYERHGLRQKETSSFSFPRTETSGIVLREITHRFNASEIALLLLLFNKRWSGKFSVTIFPSPKLFKLHSQLLNEVCRCFQRHISQTSSRYAFLFLSKASAWVTWGDFRPSTPPAASPRDSIDKRVPSTFRAGGVYTSAHHRTRFCQPCDSKIDP